jgi:hypothetical protein
MARQPSFPTIRTALASAFVALWSATTPVHAGGPAGGFSTEVTQIANNIELAASYAQQVEAYVVKYNQYLTMLQNLDIQSLALVLGASGLASAEQLKTLKSFGKSINRINDSYKKIDRIQQRLLSGASMSGMSQGAYMQAMYKGSKQRIRYFEQEMSLYQNVLKDFQRDVDELNKHASNIENIDGQVKGARAVATGVNMNARKLGEITQIMHKSEYEKNAERAQNWKDRSSMQALLQKQARQTMRLANRTPPPLTTDEQQAVNEVEDTMVTAGDSCAASGQVVPNPDGGSFVCLNGSWRAASTQDAQLASNAVNQSNQAAASDPEIAENDQAVRSVAGAGCNSAYIPAGPSTIIGACVGGRWVVAPRN